MEFYIYNDTDDTTSILDISKSCGCTEVKFESYLIDPKSKIKVSLKYNPIDDFEEINKSIIVKMNTGEFLKFEFKAKVFVTL